MSKRFLVNLDLTKNEIQNVVIHKLATAPASPSEGQIYYNTSDKRYYLRTDTTWKDVTGRLDDILSNTNAVSITDNGDGTLNIEIANANASNAGLMSSADKVLIDSATSDATAGTLVIRDPNGDASFNDITAENITINQTPTSPNHAATKAYVDGLVSSGINIRGVIDASTNPDYPAGNLGDAYYINTAGRIGGGSGPLVEPGDLIVVVAEPPGSPGGDEATAGADWIIMQANVDKATELTAGTIRIATQTEVDAGVVTDAAVTPSTLATYVAALLTAGKFAADIGDGTATQITVVHGLATEDVNVQIRDTVTKEIVETCIAITDANTITLDFTVPPTTNAYRVVIQG